MGQIMFSRNPVGTVGLGLFVVAISVFISSVIDPLFGPLAMICLAGGVVIAVLLARRRSKMPHIDPRGTGTSDDTPRQPGRR